MSDLKSQLKTTCPPEVLRLVENFHNHIDVYTSGKYNETEIRQEYVNPLFEALGWDISNKANIADAYKVMLHEDAIKIDYERPRSSDRSTSLIGRSISWRMSCTA